MATVPMFDTSESGSSEQEAAARRFERLARVRAMQRIRRRRHIAVTALVVIGLAGGVVLVRAVWSGPSTERAAEPLASPSAATAPVEPNAAGAPVSERTTRSGTAAEGSAPLAAAPSSDTTAESPPPATMPPSPAVVAPRPAAPSVAAKALPPRAARDVTSSRVPARRSPAHDVNAIPRAAVAEPEGDDATAIIDWLLHSPRTHR